MIVFRASLGIALLSVENNLKLTTLRHNEAAICKKTNYVKPDICNSHRRYFSDSYESQNQQQNTSAVTANGSNLLLTENTPVKLRPG